MNKRKKGKEMQKRKISNEKTSPDLVLVVDQLPNSTKDDLWHYSIDSATIRNHGRDGINAVYVDGHGEWVRKEERYEKIPNATTPTYEVGGLRNPGA